MNKPDKKPDYRIEIDISRQQLALFENDRQVKTFAVSTAANGPGEQQHSECTPRGRHEIAEKIGADCAVNTIFVGRRPTGEIYSLAMREQHPDRDWILTRILWLAGCEPGVNCGGNVDSHNRYIYIHGTPDDVELGKPGSRGCVRMRNADIIELFDRVPVNTPVLIQA